MDWPNALYRAIEAGLRDDALAVCVAHRGAHQWYLDGCWALPKPRQPYTRTLARCAEPGCSFAAETPHSHQVATRIEIDIDGLAAAIVRAGRDPPTERPAPRPAPASSAPPARPERDQAGTSILDRYRHDDLHQSGRDPLPRHPGQ